VLTVTETAVRLALRVQPKAGRSRVVGAQGAALKVQVAAPPVDGAANEAVVALVAEWLDLPRRDVSIVQGERGRDKVVQIDSAAPKVLAQRIAGLVAGALTR
jgi:uncharacterized protein